MAIDDIILRIKANKQIANRYRPKKIAINGYLPLWIFLIFTKLISSKLSDTRFFLHYITLRVHVFIWSFTRILAHYWQASLRFKRFRRGNVNILYIIAFSHFTFFHSCLIWLSIYKQTNYELMNLVESDRFSHLTKIKIQVT